MRGPGLLSELGAQNHRIMVYDKQANICTKANTFSIAQMLFLWCHHSFCNDGLKQVTDISDRALQTVTHPLVTSQLAYSIAIFCMRGCS